MTAAKQSAAPPVERLDPNLTHAQLVEMHGRESFKSGLYFQTHRAHSPERQARLRAIEAALLASPPIPAGQTLSAQPVASPNDADRKLMEQARDKLLAISNRNLLGDIEFIAPTLAALRSRLDGANA